MDLIEDLIKDRFGTAAANELCQKPGLFEPGRLYKRIDISKALRDEFVRRGGDANTRKDDVVPVLKKWLLGAASPFRKEARGRYRFLGHDGATEPAFDVSARGADEGRDARDDTPVPERELGAGPCEVYAWCLPQYRATLGARWPIKIGRAGPDGLERRLRDFRESLPERPCYLLRLGCADEREARERESLLHAWFRSRGQKLNDLPGAEWFLTNPSEIEEAIRNIIGPDAPVGEATSPEIEDVIAAAFKDVTADDWARLPEDLVERLDYYLYEDDRQ
ncbi:MAG: GIY-YIG nuclease family protein [Acidobacteria bacterium]|nr:GIY-YIG nuclease family protein [Acidobacteriota bacterium]